MIKKCLFPVAGYGTRFLPATKTVPKEMLPLVNKPLIHYGVREAAASGIDNMVMITSRAKKALEDYFDKYFESGFSSVEQETLAEVYQLADTCTFAFTRQMQMKGLGHAVLTGEPLIGSQPFTVILPDDVCYNDGKSVLQQLLDLYRRYDCTVLAVQEVAWASTGSYGIVAGEEEEPGVFRVRDMVEKPSPDQAPSNLAVVGRYILTPDIFDLIRQVSPDAKGEIQLTDAILHQAHEGRVIACRFQGRRFDCGSIAGMVDATNFFFEHASAQD